MRVGTPSAIGAYVAVILLFGVFGAFLYFTGALTFDGTEQSAKTVSATLMFAGAFVAAVVSIFGILIKHSIDVRAETRQQLEADRNDALAREAEERLKLDTVVRTIQLFGNENAPALPVQRAGALLALCSMKQHELALALAADLLVRSDLEPATAAAVINHAALNAPSHVKVIAGDLFFEHAHKLLTPVSYEAPNCFFHALHTLPFPVRQCAVLGFVKLLLARPLAEWRSSHTIPVRGVVMALVRAWRSEADNELNVIREPYWRQFSNHSKKSPPFRIRMGP